MLLGNESAIPKDRLMASLISALVYYNIANDKFGTVIGSKSYQLFLALLHTCESALKEVPELLAVYNEFYSNEVSNLSELTELEKKEWLAKIQNIDISQLEVVAKVSDNG